MTNLSSAQSLNLSTTVRTYYQLTKPGIIYGNGITVAASFFLAAAGSINFGRFIATLLGVSLVIGSACVCNNYIDRDIDKRMARTKQRAIPLGSVSGRSAIIYASVLGLAGFAILAYFVNWLTVAVGATGMLFYVVFYGIAKRRSIYGTEVGSISGALPILSGYTAVSGRLDLTALMLFLVLVLWQMPHFHAIALYRKQDYKSAGLPVLPVVKGDHQTKIRIMIYVGLFSLASVGLYLTAHLGLVYLAVMVFASQYWLWRGRSGFAAKNNAKWGRMMFGTSLLVLLAFSFSIALSPWLP